MSAVSPAVLHRLGGEGPPVLFVHGFGADRYGWAANAHALMPTRTVWAADLPGHGAAGNEVGDGSPAALADALALALDLDGPLPVVAHSMGAAVALHLADSAPNLFDRMVLIAPAGHGAAIDATFLAAFPELSSGEEAEALLSRLVERPRLVAPMVPHVLGGLADPSRRAALARIGAALADAPPPPAPPGVPLAILWGAADRIVPPPAGPVFGVEPTVIAGAGHLPHVEAAAAVNRLLAATLA